MPIDAMIAKADSELRGKLVGDGSVRLESALRQHRDDKGVLTHRGKLPALPEDVRP